MSTDSRLPHTSTTPVADFLKMIGAHLKARMMERDLSEQALADASGVCKKTVGNFLRPRKAPDDESNSVPSGTLANLFRLAVALDLEPWQLLCDPDLAGLHQAIEQAYIERRERDEAAHEQQRDQLGAVEGAAAARSPAERAAPTPRRNAGLACLKGIGALVSPGPLVRETIHRVPSERARPNEKVQVRSRRDRGPRQGEQPGRGLTKEREHEHRRNQTPAARQNGQRTAHLTRDR